jgi:purine-nucleoside phosphorylase
VEKNKDNIPIKVTESTKFIRSKVNLKPRIAIILGSGLGELAESLVFKKTIETSAIPHYPLSSVPGHKGRLIFGTLCKIPIIAFQGRVHFYESGNLESTLYPIRIAHALGIHTLIITNAAGGINRNFAAGDLMLISDQINLTFENPLSGIYHTSQNHQLYDKNLQSIAIRTAKTNDISLQQGVYCGVKGPSYETAAEIEMIRRFGGDAVGMSTINEVSLAATLGIKVAGISCITNMATGISADKLSHSEVTEVANRVKQTFTTLMQEFIKGIP